MAYLSKSLLVMTEQQEAVEAGTIAPETAVDVTAETETPTDSGASKWVQKLLSQRNELKGEVAEKDSTIAELKSMVEQLVDSKMSNTQRNKEIDNFKANVSEEVGNAVDEFLQANPWLTPQQGYNALYPAEASKTWPSFNMDGNVPERVKSDTPIGEMSREDVEKLATQELAAMGIKLGR